MNMYKRSKGDDLLSKDPRLKGEWKWNRSASRRSKEDIKDWTHFQVSKCKIGHWRLKAIQWGYPEIYYESVIYYGNNLITSIGENRETGTKTRIEAQIKAEKLMLEWITEEYQNICGVLI